MAFKAVQTPARALSEIINQMTRVKTEANRASTALAGVVAAQDIIGWGYSLKAKRDAMAGWAGVPGIIQYAKDQNNDQAYDVVAEYNSVSSQIDGIETWIQANMPADGDDYLLVYKFGASGLTGRTFTTGQTAPLLALMQALDSSIEL